MDSLPRTLCVLVGLLVGAHAIQRSVLYPFGPDYPDSRLPVGDDESSEEIPLRIPVTFYDQMYHSIYVNTNGHVSFGTDLPIYRADLVIPFGYRLIAPFLADIDIRISGNVYYRETEDPSLLEMAAREIHPNFPNHRNFRPRSLFVVTWDDVGYYNKQIDPVNTFQLVLASDGSETFVIFLYANVGWTRGEGKQMPVQEDVPAQAGFDSGDGRSLVLRGSGTEHARTFSQRSNAGAPGVWMFRVGQLYGENIEESEDRTQTGPSHDERADTCAAGGDRTCSVNGQCQDYNSGFCCQCQEPYVGNGFNCVEPEIRMRVNGRVSGQINGIRLDDSALHAFLMFKDGRVYVAISPVTPQLGYTLQALYAFAGGLGWLLAIPSESQSRNGYMITGGDFERTATVDFVESGHQVTIRQTYVGQNAEGHMEMHSEVNGDMPQIAQGASLEIPDYEEVYSRSGSGEVRSRSSQMFTVDGAPVHFTVDQTISFTECEGNSHPHDAQQTVSVSKNFLHFDDTEQQIVRYAQSNRLEEGTATPDPRDPCARAGYPCDSNAQCVAYGDRHQCQCNQGYRMDGRSQRCVDYDECAEGQHRCSPDADCYNNQGSYMCRCRSGYAGDGYNCERDQGRECEALRCDPNAQCVYDDYNQRYICRCNSGFTGDGYVCDRAQDCSQYNYCDRNARCQPDRSGRYTCVCNEGFEGDGQRCTEASCNVINNCDINAECLYDPHSTTYQCRCRQGYEGDGYSCRLTADCRRDARICDPHATCENRGYDYICVCRQGYRGDGYRCAPLGDQESYLMIAQGMTILQMPFTPTDDNPGEAVLSIPGQTAIGIDVDCFARYFYWTDVAGHVISKAQLDGTDSQVLISGLGSPEGIAIDWITGNMYWTDSGLDRIEASKTDGTGRKALITEDLFDPRGIVIDPVSGTMFWTDWNRDAPRIERASMDGANRKILADEDVGLPNGLTIDFDTHHVCWVDAETKRIECVNYEGMGRRVIYTRADYPFDLTYTHNVFYWTDWHKENLQSMNKFTQTETTGLKLPNGGHGRLYGIAVVRNQCPAGNNACALNNGGCRFICLPTPNGGRTCACPDDISQDECNRIGLLI